MCITTDNIYEVCRHTMSTTDPCFAARHRNIPFLRCRPRSILAAPNSLCTSCLTIFAEADIDGYSANRLVRQFRIRANYGGVLIPRLCDEGIKMMNRDEVVFPRGIPRGSWWRDSTSSMEPESARSRSTRRLQEQPRQRESLQQQPRRRESMMQTPTPGSSSSPIFPTSPGSSATTSSPGFPGSPPISRLRRQRGYQSLNRNSNLF